MGREPKKSPPKQEVQTQTDPDLEAELTKRIGSVLAKEQRDQVVSQVIGFFREEHFSGPIAHPKHLREYEDILPGAADRIISMAEKNLEHKHTQEKIALGADIKDQSLGQKLGFAALIVLVLGGIISIIYGNTAGAALFLGASALGTIGVFIKGRINGS